MPVCLSTKLRLTEKPVKASINVSSVSYKSCTLLWYAKKEKCSHKISVSQSTQIRCAQNQYPAVQSDLKYTLFDITSFLTGVNIPLLFFFNKLRFYEIFDQVLIPCFFIT